MPLETPKQQAMAATNCNMPRSADNVASGFMTPVPRPATPEPGERRSYTNYSNTSMKRQGCSALQLSPPPLKKRRCFVNVDDNDDNGAVVEVSSLPVFLNFPTLKDNCSEELQMEDDCRDEQPHHHHHQQSQPYHRGRSRSVSSFSLRNDGVPIMSLSRRTRCPVKDVMEPALELTVTTSSPPSLPTPSTEANTTKSSESRSWEEHGNERQQTEQQHQEISRGLQQNHSHNQRLQHVGTANFMTMSMKTSMTSTSSPSCKSANSSNNDVTSSFGASLSLQFNLRRLSLGNLPSLGDFSSGSGVSDDDNSSSLSSGCQRAAVRPITERTFDCLKMPDLDIYEHVDAGDSKPATSAAAASPPRNLHAPEERRRKSATAATFDYLATALRLSL